MRKRMVEERWSGRNAPSLTIRGVLVAAAVGMVLAACRDAPTATGPERNTDAAASQIDAPFDDPSTTVTPIVYGAVVVDSIKVFGAVHQYSFTGDQGHVVTIRITGTGTISGCWEPTLVLHAPNGSVLQTARPGCGGYAQMTLPLPTTGQYVLDVSDNASDALGYYNFTLHDLSSATGVPIGYGSLVIDSIKTRVQLRRYALSGTQGDIVTMRIKGTSSISGCWEPTMELYAPDGTFVQSARPGCSGYTQMTVTLPATGTFAILVGDNAADALGYFNMTVHRLSVPSGVAITYGALASDSIKKFVDIDRYTFTGNQGDVISLRIKGTGAITGCWEPTVELYTATGTFLGSARPGCTGYTALNTTLPSTGTYLILVSDNAADALGYYNFTLLRLSTPTGTTIGFHTVKRDSIKQFALTRRYKLTGKAGDIVSIRIKGTSTISGCWEPTVELYTAAGTLVGSQRPGCNGYTALNTTLPNTATYMILVSDNAADALGYFNFTVQRLSKATESVIPFGTLQIDSVKQFVQTRRYAIMGGSGAVATLRIKGTSTISGCWEPTIELYAPSGTLVQTARPGCNGYTETTLPLPVSGKYLVLVSDNAADALGYFNFTVHRVNSPAGTPITYGQTKSDSVKTLVELRRFVFTAGAGDVVTLRITSTGTISGCWEPTIELYTPTGTRVDVVRPGCGGSALHSLTLLSSGPHLMLVSDNAADALGYFNITLTSP